jgi:hypothetical protein
MPKRSEGKVGAEGRPRTGAGYLEIPRDGSEGGIYSEREGPRRPSGRSQRRRGSRKLQYSGSVNEVT